MTGGLLLIDEVGSLVEPAIRELFPQLRSDRTAWNTFVPETLTVSRVALVIPVAVDNSACATRFFEWLRVHPITPPILAILPTDSEALYRSAAEAVDDFVFWPVRDEELRRRLDRLLKNLNTDAMRNRLIDEVALRQLVGAETSFLHEIEKLPRFAALEAIVLITGETGTGKELCARALHHLSKRRPFPFIAVDCSALPDNLFENEMFGHARGAYTDAHVDHKGLVAMAERGMLFLDEIDSLSLAAQAKLLRFLQDRAYKTLGGERFVEADVNIVAASNRNLENAVRENRFRADLYYRLNVLRIDMPPLRERRGDIEALARHFLGVHSSQIAFRKVLMPSAVRKLTQYDWPGNIRELSNVIHRAALLAEGIQILASDIMLPMTAFAEETSEQSFRAARRDVIDRFEKRYIEELLQKCNRNISRAARSAGQERRAFGRLVKKHGLHTTRT